MHIFMLALVFFEETKRNQCNVSIFLQGFSPFTLSKTRREKNSFDVRQHRRDGNRM